MTVYQFMIISWSELAVNSLCIAVMQIETSIIESEVTIEIKIKLKT